MVRQCDRDGAASCGLAQQIPQPNYKVPKPVVGPRRRLPNITASTSRDWRRPSCSAKVAQVARVAWMCHITVLLCSNTYYFY